MLPSTYLTLCFKAMGSSMDLRLNYRILHLGGTVFTPLDLISYRFPVDKTIAGTDVPRRLSRPVCTKIAVRSASEL